MCTCVCVCVFAPLPCTYVPLISQWQGGDILSDWPFKHMLPFHTSNFSRLQETTQRQITNSPFPKEREQTVKTAVLSRSRVTSRSKRTHKSKEIKKKRSIYTRSTFCYARKNAAVEHNNNYTYDFGRENIRIPRFYMSSKKDNCLLKRKTGKQLTWNP